MRYSVTYHIDCDNYDWCYSGISTHYEVFSSLVKAIKYLIKVKRNRDNFDIKFSLEFK